MDSFDLLIATYLDLFLRFNGATIGNFRIFSLRFNIGSFLITGQVSATIRVGGVIIVRTARCVRSYVYFTGVNGRFISRPFSFTNTFCGTNSICSFRHDESGALKVFSFYRFIRAFIQCNSRTSVQFSHARQRIDELYFYVQWTVRGDELSCIKGSCSTALWYRSVLLL